MPTSFIVTTGLLDDDDDDEEEDEEESAIMTEERGCADARYCFRRTFTLTEDIKDIHLRMSPSSSLSGILIVD